MFVNRFPSKQMGAIASIAQSKCGPVRYALQIMTIYLLFTDDSTGLYSVYAEHQSNEIMFHVSTLLPFTPNNTQQLPRKRYIGNDIVTVVFQEPEAKPFIPNLKSQFQHVFIVVRGM